MVDRTMCEENRLSWNAATDAHNSHRGDQAAFLRGGGSTLFPEERGLLGDIAGRSLAHLQCNAGQDTLSLASLGATVTGVDISDTAIDAGRQLAADCGVPASFVCADIYDWLDATARGSERFDVAFCSYGAVCWLADLDRWAHGLASIINSGGRFVVVDFHPVAAMFDQHWNRTSPYPSGGRPLTLDGVGDYVGASGGGLTPGGFVEGVGDFTNPYRCHLYLWGLGELVTALSGAGLSIIKLEEYPYSNGERQFAGMRELPGRRMVPPAGVPPIPLMYGISARKGDGR